MSALTLRDALGKHWPEYLIEAWALGTFMVSAALCTVLLESPHSPLRTLLADAGARRALIGVAMGATAVALIYSPWGQRSGAHMNPAVTLSFLLLRKMHAWDALFYGAAQTLGALAGVLLVWGIAGSAFSAPEVNFIATLPGKAGAEAAFVAEFGISALMMFTVLSASGEPRFARYTGLFAGVLVAIFITLEAPFSGMSMNPARSLASAAPAGMWQHFWVYALAPPLGMSAAALLRQALSARGCAKLVHGRTVRCIHCGYEPEIGRRIADSSPSSDFALRSTGKR